MNTRDKSTSNVSSELLAEISLDKLIENIEKQYIKHSLTREYYSFAKMIIENNTLNKIRKDNFCIDLTGVELGAWDKQHCKAFSRLFLALSNEAAQLLKSKQDIGIAKPTDVQLVWLKLPKQDDNNRRNVNRIKKSVENQKFEDSTGNENWISLQKYINTRKANPIIRPTRLSKSVTVIIVTETEKVLLLKRAGIDGRAGTWGTLTGMIEPGEDSGQTLVREVHEEINYVLGNKSAHYVNAAYTTNLHRDLAEQGKMVSYSDDCSFVYGILVPENELINSVRLDDENGKWRLFTRAELIEQLSNVHNPGIHGDINNPDELHVSLAKALCALDASKNNFENVKTLHFTFPYTKSSGFISTLFYRPSASNQNQITKQGELVSELERSREVSSLVKK